MFTTTQLKFRILLTILFAFTLQLTFAQDYIDLFKVNYTSVPKGGYEDADGDNNVSLFDIGFTYPIKLNDKLAVITGLDYTQQSLELTPVNNTVLSGDYTLNNLTLKLGVNIKHTRKLSGTYIFLPRLSSEDRHTDGDHLFFGGLILMKYQKTELFQWRFGAYASTEGFGVLATPIIGMYYKSRSGQLEITANLPINADVNYETGQSTSVGFGLLAPVKTYSLKSTDDYVQVSNIEFGPYFEYRLLNESLLLRAQAGYEALSYEAFKEGDELPFRLSALEFGDDRELLNPAMQGSFFVKVGAIYRFRLNK